MWFEVDRENIFFLTDCPWAKKIVRKPKRKLYLQSSASADVFVFISPYLLYLQNNSD